MAQTDSQSSEFEASNDSNGSSDLPESPIDGRPADEELLSEDNSFQSSVGEMLDSIETDSTEEDAPERAADDMIDAKRQTAAVDPADELLIRAGSILNGGETEIPDTEATGETAVDSNDEGSEGLMDFPDPQSFLLESEEEDPEESGDSEGLVSMPDPQSLIKAAGDDVTSASRVGSSESDPEPAAATKATEENRENEDREPKVEPQSEIKKGENPIEGSEQFGEDFAAKPPEALSDTFVIQKPVPSLDVQSEDESSLDLDTMVEEASSQEADSDDGYDDDLLLDDDAGDDLFLDSDDGFSISDDDDDLLGGSARASAAESNRSQNETGGLAQASRYITWPVAAGLAFVGLSILTASFKGPILDFLAHGDIQETRIQHVVAEMTEEVFNSVESGQPYDLAWVESDIRRVSDSEYRVNAKIGVRLKEDLFGPLDETYVYTLLPFSRAQLEQATAFVDESRDLPPELKFPRPGWTRLYKRQGAKGEVFEIDAQYRIMADGEKKGSWELSNLRVNGNGNGLDWTSILPRSAFEEGAVDVDAMEFAYYLRAYEKAGIAYLEEAKAYEQVWMASRSEKAERLQRLREELIMSLSQGSYFSGVAILGEASEETREVSLVVTETRADGELIKGLLKLEGEDDSPKHFTGVLDIIEDDEAVQGHLELTTIAFAGQPHDTPAFAFFKPGTVSRIQMNTDGRMLEGDSDAISLRLMRGR